MMDSAADTSIVLGPLAEFEEQFPPIIARTEVRRITGGIITAKTIEHDESRRRGPEVFMYVAGKRCYPRRSFLAYLEAKGVERGQINPIDKVLGKTKRVDAKRGRH